ncbi:guanine deaminase [Amylibacter sp. IMCC11727]|uniref:guanine deaminase n=1 Tax=Amylibacter sp. IMCC11727 TaxID=3039851 RepID=UPI00244DCF2F|nr:guanine deaminase [Amylibacter sp. IMCC11727]WGI20606.1 guanine deaminase [Amylibacter sp. IMCC11727]
MTKLILGQTLSFTGNPFTDGPDAAHHERRGAVVIDGGKITAVGPADQIKSAHPNAEVTDMDDHLLMAGFIDAHVHYPQTAIIASWGKRLIDWLNTYTFPEERRFADPEYAAKIANAYCDFALSNGTTTAASFCTIHPESVDAYFQAAADRNMRMVGGKTCMNRNAIDGLHDTTQSAYDDSKALIDRWHGTGRATYAITPRFSPTSTDDQLAALGGLWSERPTCLMQTHLSEQTEEIAWVRELFPNARDYLDTYEQHGLVREGAIMGHSIHLTDREIATMRDHGVTIAHCPTSNTFIGSGLCDVTGLNAAGVTTGLATDTGGGSSFSMLHTMAAAYEVAQLRGDALHASHLLYLATVSSAKTLGLSDKIGNLEAGKEADLIALNLASTAPIELSSARATDIWESIFPTIMMGDDRAISGVWIAGQRQTLT